MTRRGSVLRRIGNLVIFCTITALLLIGSAAFTFASEASFVTDSVTAQEGRLLTVAVRANGGDAFAAADFIFTYDAAVLEYRDCTSADAAVCKSEAGCLHVSYLREGGNSAGGAALFTLQFKALAAGNARLSYTMSDCVDWNAESVDIGACSAGAVTVTAAKNSRTVQKTSGAPTATAPTVAAEREQTTAPHTADKGGSRALDFINTADEAEDNRLLAPLLTAAGSTAAAALVVFLTVRHFQKKKTTGKNE